MKIDIQEVRIIPSHKNIISKTDIFKMAETLKGKSLTTDSFVLRLKNESETGVFRLLIKF